jgi:uncharacterized membrane protein
MWIIFSLLSATSESLKDTFSKIGSTKSDEYTAATALHVFTVFITLPLVLWHGIPDLKASFWWGTLGFLPITPLWSVAYMKAVKLSPLTEVLPMMAFNPIFTALLAFVFTGRGLSLLGWFGIFLISLGIYAVNLKPEIVRMGVLSPLQAAFTSKGSRYMLLVAFLWSIGAYLSQWRVAGSDPLFSTLTSGLVGITMTPLLALALRKPIRLTSYLKSGWSLLPIGIFYYLANLLSSYALLTGPVAYVFAIKRGSIVASAITGKYIFKEKLFTAKVIGLFLIIGGIFFLIT